MITIGLSSHHVEALPFIREQMERHEVIVLEEPPSLVFADMLEDRMSIEEYLMETDSEFPRFDTLLCGMMRQLHKKGKRILQVEPYMERLLSIHERFASGESPEEVARLPELGEVYRAERRATGALIRFYAASVNAPFTEVVQTVKAFAQADANRIALRDRLRARAIAQRIGPEDSVYVEAGYIHALLHRFLRREIGTDRKVKVVFLLAPIVRKLGARRRNLGPGDILTLYYMFGRNPPEVVADLPAARSLIYIKLIEKEELLPGPSPAPHSEDELRASRMVERLSLDDCAHCFGRIRALGSSGARALVEEYLEEKSRKL